MSISNRLKNESSPYLLQHANNPVNWFPWCDEALALAKKENKLILVSIGYSACHWCHVMEHESFEDVMVAELMNKHFVCIKVDREERPDIDQVYMSAVQLMTGRGGWPLNCFALPDGRPVYGGTYFPKDKWMNLLENLADSYTNEPDKFYEYAAQLKAGVLAMDNSGSNNGDSEISLKIIHASIKKWKSGFDTVNGGPDRAPKFPLPNNYLFLLKYGVAENDEEVINHVKLTLKKMAYGGIYDQIGGGFARYSVDGIWKVPHFEKMLYDNAQLISLYSEAYKVFKDPLYERVVSQTIEFVLRELHGNTGNFYSALDADSEGVEGKYYIWKKEELQEILGNDFLLYASYYNVNESGFWENENYILLREKDDEDIAEAFKLTLAELSEKINKLNEKLLIRREARIKPGLDDKTITSWNALMITALLDAYDSFSNPDYLNKAGETLNFILETQCASSGMIHRTYKNGKSAINGYLDDYAFLIESLIRMYQCTFEIKWLHQAHKMTEFVMDHFSDPQSNMLYYTSDFDAPLFARQKEIQDNVLPGSNSQMAINLFYLSSYFENENWRMRSKSMVSGITDQFTNYPSAYSNWLLLAMLHAKSIRELVFCGINSLELRRDFLHQCYIPDVIVAGCVHAENIALTRNRLHDEKTLIYFCNDHTCNLPASSVAGVIEQIKHSDSLNRI